MISDENLNGYTRSTTLPEPNHYNLTDRNPILYVLADQARQDGDFPEGMTDEDILDGIIKGLQNKTVEWPEDDNLLPMENWIPKIQSDMSFYISTSRDEKEFQAFDHQLVQICANYLKRQINLIPFPEGEPQIFHPKSRSTSAKSLNILSCNTAYRDSFAVSIFKNEIEEEQNASSRIQISSGKSYMKTMKNKAKSFFRK